MPSDSHFNPPSDSATRVVGELSSPTQFGSRGVPTVDPRVGPQIGKYKVLGMLGRGGMGAVYEAEDPTLKRRVAIKVLPETAGENAEALRRFIHEAQAAAKLTHPNVVVIHEIDCKDGLHFIVMELVRGGSAQDYINNKGALPWVEAARAVAEACRGLSAAHAAGIIHRDIKPANIMCSTDGSLKIADFGLAKSQDLELSSRTGMSLGTPRYMSPEQCRSEPIDARADIYSLGATFYAMLTGRTPYGAAENTAQVMFAHCFQPPPDPREYVADIPEGCAAIVRKAMAKERENRYPSADAMLADLEALLASAPAGQARDLTEWTKFIKTDRGAPATIPLPATRPGAAPAAVSDRRWFGNPQVWAAALLAATLTGLAVWAALRPGDRPGPAVDLVRRDDAGSRSPPTDAGRGDAGGKTDGGASPVPDPETDKSKDKDTAGSFTYELYLVKAGDKKMDVVRVVREYNRFLNHVQAMDLVDRPPKKVYESTIKYEVDAARRKFEQWGAVLEIKTKYWPGKTDTPTKPAVPRLTPQDELDRIEKKIRNYADEALPTEVRNTVRELVAFAGRHLEATDEDARKIGARAKELAVQWYAEADRLEAALPKPRLVFKEHDGGVNAAAVTRDGSLAASAGADHMVRIWRTSDGKELQVLAGHEISAVTVAFSPDDKYVASGGGDRTVRIWDYESGRQKALIEGFDHWVTGLAFSPDGKMLAGASEQRIRLLETTEWKEIAVFKGHGGDVNTLAFSPDGADLAAGDDQGVIKIYDVKSGKVRYSLLWHTGSVRGLVYVPGGKSLISTGADRTIRFWNTVDGSEIGQIKHTDALLTVALSPDGRTVAASTYDGVVRFWDAQERRRLRLIRAHNYAQGPRKLLFFPDGKTLLTASPDGTVKLWETGR